MTDEIGTIEELALHPGDEVEMIEGDERDYLNIPGVVNEDGNVEMVVGVNTFRFKPQFDAVSGRKWRVVPRMSPEALDGPQDVAQAARVEALEDIVAMVSLLPIRDHLPDDVPVTGVDGIYITQGHVRQARELTKEKVW